MPPRRAALRAPRRSRRSCVGFQLTAPAGMAACARGSPAAPRWRATSPAVRAPLGCLSPSPCSGSAGCGSRPAHPGPSTGSGGSHGRSSSFISPHRFGSKSRRPGWGSELAGISPRRTQVVIAARRDAPARNLSPVLAELVSALGIRCAKGPRAQGVPWGKLGEQHPRQVGRTSLCAVPRFTALLQTRALVSDGR